MEDADAYDLIAEWVEPKRIKGWLNVHAGNAAVFAIGPYSTRDEATTDAETLRVPRVACIEIDCLEGEGLK